MLKKIVGGLLLAILILVVAGPFFAGMKAESELKRFAEKASQYPGYHLQWQAFDRGWFSSDAVLLVQVDTAGSAGNGQAGAIEVPLNAKLHHGPLMFGGDKVLGWLSWTVQLAEEQSAWLNDYVEKEAGPLYWGKGHMNLVGTVHFSDELQPFSVDNTDTGILINSEGYAGSGSVSRGGQMSYSGLLRNTDFTAQDALLALGATAIRANGDLSRIDWDTFLYPMDFYVNFASVHVQGSGETYRATNAELEGVVEKPREHDWFSLVMSMNLGDFAGPQLNLEGASMTFAYERISLAAYQAYMRAMTEAESTGGQPDIAAHFTPEVMEQFFANGPAFVLRNLSFTMPEGDFKGDLSLSLGEDLAVPGQMTNPLMLLQALVLKANAEIDRPLALYFARETLRSQLGAASEDETEAERAELQATLEQMAEETIATLAAQGMLVEDGDDLKATLAFIEGQLTLNGTPMPLPLEMLFGGQ